MEQYRHRKTGRIAIFSHVEESGAKVYRVDNGDLIYSDYIEDSLDWERLKDHVAFACRTCNKIYWIDSKTQQAFPEHVSHRGVDIGNCKGKMIPLYM